VAVSNVDKLVDYCMNTAPDGFRSATSVETLRKLIEKNKSLMQMSEKAEKQASVGSHIS
jgi:4-O-beta-D-mannosyl-D-glucose phosphorylase